MWPCTPGDADLRGLVADRRDPAAQSRQILALTGRLETLALAKKPAAVKPPINSTWNA